MTLKQGDKVSYYWMDYWLSDYKWYRRFRGGTWYRHRFSSRALDLSITFTGDFYARYGKINEYSDVVNFEVYS